MLLRRQIGGYHAHSHFSCIICSTAIGSFSLLLNTFWKYIPAFGYFCLILLLPFIVRHSPVLHPNHPVTKELKNSARKKGILLFITETIVSLLFFLFYPPFAYPIISGIFSAEILCILGYYKNFSHWISLTNHTYVLISLLFEPLLSWYKNDTFTRHYVLLHGFTCVFSKAAVPLCEKRK